VFFIFISAFKNRTEPYLMARTLGDKLNKHIYKTWESPSTALRFSS
jgi:hypothetical protein